MSAWLIDLQALPENCIANVISLTTPRDACRMSLISKRFNSAANSDDAWERFLPPQITLSHHSEGEAAAVNTKSKKELYFTVCDKPTLIDQDQMSISVEKGSGKKHYMIAARRLQIAWSNGRQSELLWKYLPPESRPQGADLNRSDPLHLGRVIQDALPGYRFLRRSRFKEAAYLHNCSCLEIRGRIKIRMLSPWTMYKAYLVYNSFSLDKWSGKKCYMIAARRLRIAWGDTPEYWTYMGISARVQEAAKLEGVGWLEIRGRIETRMLSPSTTYKAYLVYKLTKKLTNTYAYGLEWVVTVGERAYGFDYECPGLEEITAGIERTAVLAPLRELLDSHVRIKKLGTAKFPNENRADGWLEMELGEFHCQGDEDGELEIICCEIQTSLDKSGLLVQGIELRPKRNMDIDSDQDNCDSASLFQE